MQVLFIDQGAGKAPSEAYSNRTSVRIRTGWAVLAIQLEE